MSKKNHELQPYVHKEEVKHIRPFHALVILSFQSLPIDYEL